MKRREFKPTYLYIKQHAITGKLYFGKTNLPLRKMLQYTGSGTRWRRHILKHDASHVITLWYYLYDNVFDLVADALSISKNLDIVKSNAFLNQIPENGRDGNIQFTSRIPTNKKRPQNTKGCKKSASHTNKKLKQYLIQSPDGITYTILGLKNFCIEHNLHVGHMSQVAMGKEPHYKKWKCSKLTLTPCL